MEIKPKHIGDALQSAAGAGFSSPTPSFEIYVAAYLNATVSPVAEIEPITVTTAGRKGAPGPSTMSQDETSIRNRRGEESWVDVLLRDVRRNRTV